MLKYKYMDKCHFSKDIYITFCQRVSFYYVFGFAAYVVTFQNHMRSNKSN